MTLVMNSTLLAAEVKLDMRMCMKTHPKLHLIYPLQRPRWGPNLVSLQQWPEVDQRVAARADALHLGRQHYAGLMLAEVHADRGCIHHEGACTASAAAAAAGCDRADSCCD